MGQLQDHFDNPGNDYKKTLATLAVNQEDGRVCYALGLLHFTPAMVRPESVSSFRLGTAEHDPMDCFFSDMLFSQDIQPTAGGLGLAGPAQHFDAKRSRKLRLSLSQSTFAGLTLRITLEGNKAVTIPVVEQADLYSGSGPSIHNEALAGYVLSLRQYDGL
ncbi:MAG TPA: hypothetical protein VF650_16870 [Allosphingosinicella sp.]|jgi:hypothetical protein